MADSGTSAQELFLCVILILFSVTFVPFPASNPGDASDADDDDYDDDNDVVVVVCLHFTRSSVAWPARRFKLFLMH